MDKFLIGHFLMHILVSFFLQKSSQIIIQQKYLKLEFQVADAPKILGPAGSFWAYVTTTSKIIIEYDRYWSHVTCPSCLVTNFAQRKTVWFYCDLFFHNQRGGIVLAGG